jgi:uncharacterized protein (TIGR00730 family)
MESPVDPNDHRVLDAWSSLKSQANWDSKPIADANRLAFADPEFLLRRETRGIRFQLELLKPDLTLQAHGIHQTVVVFGSSRFLSEESAHQKMVMAQQSGDEKAIARAKRQLANARFYEQARALGHLITRSGATLPEKDRYYICTGGGPGIMEAANRGAQEAGGKSVGLNIALPHEQQPNPFITPELCFQFHYFALRKMHFLMRASALVAFPGGFGTLDELFETLTLIQTRKVQPVPVVLFGSDFWHRLIDFDVLVEEGAISAEDLDLFKIMDDVNQAWDFIQAVANA